MQMGGEEGYQSEIICPDNISPKMENGKTNTAYLNGNGLTTSLHDTD